ncbi:MAG: NblA-related protein [Dolichospermum sp.]
MQLTTEQQFAIAAFKMQVQQMSPEQVKQQLVERYEGMITREAEFLQLLGDAWGMG